MRICYWLSHPTGGAVVWSAGSFEEACRMALYRPEDTKIVLTHEMKGY